MAGYDIPAPMFKAPIVRTTNTYVGRAEQKYPIDGRPWFMRFLRALACPNRRTIAPAAIMPAEAMRKRSMRSLRTSPDIATPNKMDVSRSAARAIPNSVPWRFDYAIGKRFFEHDGALTFHSVPFAHGALPLLRGSIQREIDQFRRRLVAWDVPPCPYGTADFCVERLDGVGGVNQPSGGSSRNGMTSFQARRRLGAMAGYLAAGSLSSNSAGAASAAAASTAV